MVFKCLFNSLILLTLASNLWAKSSADIVKEGNAGYRQGKYEDAIKSYQDAVTQGGQESVARYNLSNAFYRQGMAKATTNIDGAIADLEQSVAGYAQVMAKNAKDADAKFNREIATKALEKLKKQKKEQQKQQQNNKDQKKDQSDKNNKDGQDKKDKGQNNKDQGQQNKGQDRQKQEQEQGKGQQDKVQQQKQENQQGSKDQKQGEQQKDQAKQDQQGKAEQGQMTKEEAKDILEDYQRNEEPKGMLNFIEKDRGNEQPVSKDW